MRIQTFSIVAGSEACNARCPFCISKMTVAHGVTLKQPEVNWRNFRKACLLAQQNGVTTAMLTSKGEPTLFPDQLTQYLEVLSEFSFPLIELQTNGVMFQERPERYRSYLERWYELGLSTVAVSIVSEDPEENRKIYLPHKDAYPDLGKLVKLLRDHGLSVRLTCTMLKDVLDTPEALVRLVDFARQTGAEQLTVRPVNQPDPDRSRDPEVSRWTKEQVLSQAQVDAIAGYLEQHATRLMTLPHGAVVYDLAGQNICLTDCLTIESGGQELRQLIFFPDGHLRYDWQYAGATLL